MKSYLKLALSGAIIVLLMLLPAPRLLAASPLEFTAALEQSFNKTVAKAKEDDKTVLQTGFRSISSLHQEEQNQETKVKSMHLSNESTQQLLNKKIQEIGKSRISQLERELSQTKARYQPLLDLYTSLNRRITSAKRLKDKDLNAILKTQAEGMKVAVQLARAEIKLKQQMLSEAKQARTQQVKKAKGMLSPITSYKSKIKSEKSRLSTVAKRTGTHWKDFKQALRKTDPSAAARTLNALTADLKQLVQHQQNLVSYEQQIADLLQKARQSVPA
ncbi:hypothetical protein DCC85_01665 [Paenibacillus sp. CAA11]|uniref:hypothetical protein n=1 Tax=Paenibacillus sp. CAA11 TaxID=1532905 RepID=UPI000D389B86|nr:hypothetical protein [Paenibacillus sp. CAA11]AWB43063.1 hypothetical protein DCC85_01665 [Paenibacillus sp. CAA11]